MSLWDWLLTAFVYESLFGKDSHGSQDCCLLFDNESEYDDFENDDWEDEDEDDWDDDEEDEDEDEDDWEDEDEDDDI